MLCEKCAAEISEDASGFDAFWRAYPKKADKLVAFRSWKKLRPADRLAVMNDLPRRIPTWNLNGQTPGEFRPSPPNPSTYLNKRRWEDEISVPAVVKPAPVNGGLAARPVAEVVDPDLSQTPAQRRANMARLGSILDGLGKIF